MLPEAQHEGVALPQVLTVEVADIEDDSDLAVTVTLVVPVVVTDLEAVGEAVALPEAEALALEEPVGATQSGGVSCRSAVESPTKTRPLGAAAIEIGPIRRAVPPAPPRPSA